MSSIGQSSKKGNKGKVVENPGRNHVWTPDEDDKLIQCLLVVSQNPKWKCDNGTFRGGVNAKLEKMMRTRWPDTVVNKSQIQSRTKWFKNKYAELSDILGDKGSGFGWNDKEKCVVAELAVWEEWGKSHPNAKALMNRRFPYYDECSIIFGKDRATGKMAECPQDVVEEYEQEEEIYVVDKVLGPDSNVPDDNVYEVPINNDNSQFSAFYDNVMENEVEEDASEGGDSGSANPSTPHSQPMSTAATSFQMPQTVNNNKSKRPRRSFGQQDSTVENQDLRASFTKAVDMIRGTTDGLRELVSCFKHMQSKEARRQQVYDQLSSIQGLSTDELMKGGTLILADDAKVQMLLMLQGEAKAEYVRLIAKNG